MQKEEIRRNKNIDLETFAALFEEDIIILNQNMQVVYMNSAAMKNLAINDYKPHQTDCKEVFKNLNPNCTICKIPKLEENQKTIHNYSFDETNDYQIIATILSSKITHEKLILLKGQKSPKKDISENTNKSKVWKINISIDHKIIDSDGNSKLFSRLSKEEVLKSNLIFSDFLHENYKTSYLRAHQKAIDSGKPEELLSILKTNKAEQRVLLKLIPNKTKKFTDCTIEITSFLKDVEDEKTQFENLRIQKYLYTITDNFARADNIQKGYKSMVTLVNEAIDSRLCGIIHFKDKKKLFIKSALVGTNYHHNTEPEIDQPDVLPYFTRQLIINDIITIPDVGQSKVLYKDELKKSGVQSFFALPLKHNLRLVGAIILGFSKKRTWQKNHIDFIKSIGSIVLHSLLQDEVSEKLRRVNENFLNIFESSSDAVFIVQLDGQIKEVNRAAETLSGYSRKELTRKNVSEISKSEKLNLSKLPYEMLQSHQMIFGTELINRNGEKIAIETREKMIRFEDQLSVLIIARDVRHRREINKMMVQTISETEDNERKRIAEGLHDDVGPLLSTLRIYIDLLKNEKLTEQEIDEYAIKMNEIIHQTIETVREVSRNLMPGVLNDFGLIEALEDFCIKINKTGVLRINFDYDAKHYNLGNSIRNVIYTVIKELINNSIKHADASEIHLKLNQNGKDLIISLEDNGIGFDMEKTIDQDNSGLGLKNLVSKVNAISGEIELIETKGFGIKIRVPIK